MNDQKQSQPALCAYYQGGTDVPCGGGGVCDHTPGINSSQPTNIVVGVVTEKRTVSVSYYCRKHLVAGCPQCTQ